MGTQKKFAACAAVAAAASSIFAAVEPCNAGGGAKDTAAPSGVVSFKDAAKIKSWDAWNDHKKPKERKEKPSVTWKKLNGLNPGLREIGRLAVRGAKDVKSSKWSVGCETLDRDYADWDAYKHLLEPLGVKHGRLFSGWAKTEQEKGVYDFTWLDPQVREMAAMGVKPWICLSYGNPVWGSDFRLGMRVKQVTGSPDAFEAWLRYVAACVERYKDVVDEWEIWNEPFHQGPEYAEMFYRTAKTIRAVQPSAKCFCTAITFPEDYKCVLEKLKRENALDLGSYFIYHPYDPNPDASYAKRAEPLRRLVKGYSPAFDVMQGEVGCPAQLEFAHALANIEWTEYSQAKWNLRRAIGDAVRSIPSNVFTMIDLQYTFMLQSFGLVRSNTLKEHVYRRPSYYAMQNVYALFDDDTLPKKHLVVKIGGRGVSCNLFSRDGKSLRAYWFCDNRPYAELSFSSVDLEIPAVVEAPVWVEMITGRVFEIPEESIVRRADGMTLKGVPMWDSPVIIAPRAAIPLLHDAPSELGKIAARLKPLRTWAFPYAAGVSYDAYVSRKVPPKAPRTEEGQPWTKLSVGEFFPFIDKYGQFAHKDWPDKVHSDADFARQREKEEADLAAHPGPKGWDKWGGWADGPQFPKTGGFSTTKWNGKWWIVDPDGHLWWSHGPVRVLPSSAMTPLATPAGDRSGWFQELPAKDDPVFGAFYETRDVLLWPYYTKRGIDKVYDFSAANLRRKYGEKWFETWADLAHRRLRSWGCNTIANSSDKRICLMDRTPYTERFEIHSRPIAGHKGGWWPFCDPFDPSFRAEARRMTEVYSAEIADPWCMGFFVDNEHHWGKPHSFALSTLKSPADQPCKAVFRDRLKAKYGTVEKLNAAWKTAYADWDAFMSDMKEPKKLEGAMGDLEAFSAEIADNYFRIIREELKRANPGKLYLGCRWAQTAPAFTVKAAAKYCDVISYNVYRKEMSAFKLPEGVDAPVLIGEFHFGALDRGPFCPGLILLKDQKHRAETYRDYVRTSLEHPQIVGVHWHQFSDQATSGRFDGENMQVGWTDVCDTPYWETVEAVRDMGSRMYELRAGAAVPAVR